jgi:predicted RNase H-like HicB family nuclease
MRFPIKLTFDAEHGYRAWCPGLPGCRAHASSEEEAVQNLRQAVRGYLASMDAVIPADVEPLVEPTGG